MLIYSWQKHSEKDIVKVDLDGQTSLQNLFAKVLINGVNHLFKRGVNKDYRSESDAIRTVKGKIDFTTSIKKNLTTLRIISSITQNIHGFQTQKKTSERSLAK